MPYTTLISARQLAAEYGTCLIIDCRFSLGKPRLGAQTYQDGHLPNAVYADLDLDLSSKITALTGRHPLPNFTQLVRKLRDWGVSNDSQVVVYDDVSGGFASRLWWLLRTLGHSNVAVLNGGIQAWEMAGQIITKSIESPNSGSFAGQANQSAWCDVDTLQTQLKQANCVLIDARAAERFSGEDEPIDPIAGHIPGAVNLPVAETLDKEGTFLDPLTIRARYLNAMRDIPSNRVIHSCGSGVFACMGVLAMEYAGLAGSKIYPGSWSEWILDPQRPIATGE